MRFVTVPGIGNSDGGHWQSIWQTGWGDEASRIAPSSWTEPDLDDWCEAIDREVRAEKDVVIVAHSMGCLAAAHRIAIGMHEPIHRAHLVTPSDRYAHSFPAVASTFVAAYERPVEVPGLIVRSDDDPYCTPKAAKEIARHWELHTVNAGALGHINSESEVGEWIQGQTLLSVFLAMATPMETMMATLALLVALTMVLAALGRCVTPRYERLPLRRWTYRNLAANVGRGVRTIVGLDGRQERLWLIYLDRLQPWSGRTIDTPASDDTPTPAGDDR